MSTFLIDEYDDEDERNEDRDGKSRRRYVCNPLPQEGMKCASCGSKDMWDDNFYWGCNSCGAGNILAKKPKKNNY